MSRDIARERLKEIRSLQGWREAYKAAGLTSEGSDATKRRRLSRLVNPKTSGAKKLDAKERRKINRTYRTRRDKGVFSGLRAEKAVKSINKAKTAQRRKASKVFGPRGSNPDRVKLARRNRKYKNLTPEQIEALEEAFKRAEEDGGVSLRAEYAKHMSSISISDIPETQRRDFERRRKKAIDAEERDRDKKHKELIQ